MRRSSNSLLTVLFSLVACSRSNNLLLGRVETTVDGHRVVVTDCYRTVVPPPVAIGGTPAGYRYAPCRDAVIVIRGDRVEVNRTEYPGLRAGDSVTVDHGRVLINDREPARGRRPDG